MSAEFPKKTEVVPAETKEEKMARLRAELAALEEPEAPTALEMQTEAPDETVQEQAGETVATLDLAAAERASVDASDLAATRERLGMPPLENVPEVSPADSERVQLLGGQLESLGATGGKSAERLRNIFNEVNRNPELFDGNSERSKAFMSRIREKTTELKSGPEIMLKKREFWKKWKTSSILAGAGSILGMVGEAAWGAKYGFDHTLMVNVLGQSLNGPMIAGLVGGYLSIGSLGIAKLMEVLRGDKYYKLRENLRHNNI